MADVNGYKAIYCPKHPRVIGNSGEVYEHILVAEEKLGRRLKLEEVVHHLDYNRSNNAPDNLLVFASHAEHASFHKGIPYFLDEEGIAHVITKQVCPLCGKKKDGHAEMCIECHKKKQGARADLVGRDALKHLIRTKPFTQIAKQYNVSDNAIRKWCDRYNLPRTKTIINSYSDTDWQKI